jgi:hypothetical protein
MQSAELLNVKADITYSIHCAFIKLFRGGSLPDGRQALSSGAPENVKIIIRKKFKLPT